MKRAYATGLLCILAVGCAHHKGDDDDTNDSAATLTIGPAMSELQIVNDVPASEDFTATLTYPDGTIKDVTATTQFAIDTSLGSFAAATLSMTGAGKTVVYGTLADKTATAQVIGRLQNIRVDPGVSPDAPTWFGAPEDPTRAPTVVYPPVGVVMPRNLGDFEVHWTDVSNNDVYEVSLTTEFATVKAYVAGGNGNVAAGAGAAWMQFVADEWIAAVGNEASIVFQVRGVQSTNPVAVGSTTPQQVNLSNEQMLGGLYYWAATAASGPYGIFRHDMAQPGVQAQQYMTTAQTNGRCVACHVLSRDGTKMAVTYDGGGNPATMVDVATAVAQPATDKWNFGTFTPDGSEFLSVENGTLVVRNYADQAVVATMTAAGKVSHPDLSADGTQLTYVHPGVAGSDWAFGSGSIYVRTFDQATLTFGPERQLVANTANNYYPSFSPDGVWILYNQGDNTNVGNENMSYNGPNASLWVVKADGTAPPVQLTASNQALGLTNSWGRWAPFAQTLGASNQPMFWVTVSSKRNFGVRLVNIARPQIWMTPFFPDQAEVGADPSAAAFRLPFQIIDSDNHIAQWTEQVVTAQ